MFNLVTKALFLVSTSTAWIATYKYIKKNRRNIKKKFREVYKNKDTYKNIVVKESKELLEKANKEKDLIMVKFQDYIKNKPDFTKFVKETKETSMKKIVDLYESSKETLKDMVEEKEVKNSKEKKETKKKVVKKKDTKKEDTKKKDKGTKK